MLTFCSWWGGSFSKTGFEHWKSIKHVSRMKILHCREVALISAEAGQGIIILSMILLYRHFIYHGLLKVAFDLLWVCAGKRFPGKEQTKVIKDLTNAEWKRFVGKNGTLTECKRTLQDTFLNAERRIFRLCRSCCLNRAAGQTHKSRGKAPSQASCALGE